MHKYVLGKTDIKTRINNMSINKGIKMNVLYYEIKFYNMETTWKASYFLNINLTFIYLTGIIS